MVRYHKPRFENHGEGITCVTSLSPIGSEGLSQVAVGGIVGKKPAMMHGLRSSAFTLQILEFTASCSAHKFQRTSLHSLIRGPIFAIDFLILKQMKQFSVAGSVGHRPGPLCNTLS